MNADLRGLRQQNKTADECGSTRIRKHAGPDRMKFSELVRLLEKNGFRLVKAKGSIRYYSKPGYDKLIRVDYHGAKEVPTGTFLAFIKAGGINE